MGSPSASLRMRRDVRVENERGVERLKRSPIGPIGSVPQTEDRTEVGTFTKKRN